MIYKFDRFTLDPTERRLLKAGEPVPLPPKAFDALVVLVENDNRLVEKETLLHRVWAESFVEEGNLKICVHTLRKALGDARFIETVPKKGYRFSAPVEAIEDQPHEILVEKRVVSQITLGATALDDSGNAAFGARRSVAKRRLLSRKIYAGALFLLLLLILGGAFYYAQSRQSRNLSATTSNPLAGVKSIAVLPLKSLNTPPSEPELRVGLSDSIVTKLAAIKQIAVRPTSATIRYLDKDYELKKVGEELNVDSILEGSVQKEGTKLKINLQMVGVGDGKVLWADTFTNDLSNFLNGQESVAYRVSRLLSSGVAPPESGAATNPSAQELYLKARYAMATSTRKIENVFQARDFYEQAIRLDAGYAPAYAGLASTYALASSLNLLSPREAYPKVEMHARRALEIDPNSAEAHSTLAEVEANYYWNWQAADEEYRRALELNPNAAGIHEDYAEFLARMGRFEESEYHGDLAHRLDPTAINIEAVKALHYCYARRFSEASAQSEAVVVKDPDAYLAYLYLALSEDALGNYEKAAAAAARAAAITGGAPPDLFAAGSTSALKRDERKTQEILTKLTEASRRQYVDPFYFAMIYAVRGDNEKALDYLEKCRVEKSYWITTLKVFPFLDRLRSEARFAELLRELKLDS